MKERTYEGTVMVRVRGPGFLHATYVQVRSPLQQTTVHNQVNYARSLAWAGR